MKFYYLILLLLSGTFLPGCHPREEVSLFNGEDLDQWIVKGKPEDVEKGFWTVREGYVEANTMGQPGHDYVWLQSIREYKDFDLTFEFQAFHESPGNSGIQIHSWYDDETNWMNGPQIDIHPPACWRTGMMWDETRGNQRWIFPDVPAGEWVDSTMVLNHIQMNFSEDPTPWNRMRVRVQGNHIKAWLNEIKITDYDGEGILNDGIHRQREAGVTGHIAFQIHTGDELKIRFRHIFLRER
jgi:hypothetical protein